MWCGAWLLVCLLASPAWGVIRDGGIDPANLGKGEWIVTMTDATNRLGGHVNSVTNENSLMLFYKSIGVRYIIIKAATSNYLFTGCYNFPQFNSNVVNIAHSHGIKVFGYNRSYGGDIPGEIEISDYVFREGADGFVWDAEAEWESNKPWIGANGPALAWALCGAVRTNWPNKFLAHAPFPIISYHSSFPYKEFGYWCDAIMPQIYFFNWTGVKRSPSGGIDWTDANWTSWQNSLVGTYSVVNGQTIYWTNSIKPLAPVNNVYGEIIPGGSSCFGNSVSTMPDKNVMEFIDYLSCDPNGVTAGGYQGANFYRTDLHGVGQFANIGAGISGSFPGIVNNIVIDSPRVTASGSWTSVRTFSNGAFYGNGSGTDTNSFGTNYLTRSQGSGSAYVQFTPAIIVPGDYRVFQWHPYRADASASVPHTISYNGGSTTVYANQQTNDGNWSLLGTFNFAAGDSGYIRVTDGIAESGAVAIADGVKLVFVPPTSVPAAPSGLTASAVSSSQIDLAWSDNATNESAYVVARSTTAGGPYANISVLPLNATSYSDTGLVPATTYYYVVWATNYLGASANSAEANATTTSAGTPPSITTQPQGQTVILGGTASFSVVATGGIPLAYQWRLNGADISGATASSYSRANVQATDAGDYSVLVTNPYGSLLSSNAMLVVDTDVTLPVITAQPQSQTVIAGQSVTFTVTATNKAALSYQWRYNAAPIAGATGSSYTRSNVQTTDAGSYSVVITNIIGSVTSADAVLTVHFSLTATATGGGTVSKSPDQASYAPNTVVTLTAGANTGYAFTGWSGDASGTNNPLQVTMAANKAITASFVSSETDIILDNTNAAVSFDGLWQIGTATSGKYGDDYRFAVTAAGGLSNAVFRPYIHVPGRYDVYIWYTTGVNRATNAPWSIVYEGGSLNVSVDQQVNGSAWVLIGSELPFVQGTNGYVRLSNDTGYAGKVVMADAVRFTFVGPPHVAPTITTHPESQNVNQGGNAVFGVVASGTPAPAYQWRKNGTPIGGATDAGYTVANAQPADAGSYTVEVLNVAGQVTSSSATLTVNVPPAITAQPQSLSVTAGSNATFTVTATGTAPLHYQWRFNGTDLAEATGSSYLCAKAQATDAGSYAVVVSNMAGVVTSADAVLSVTQPAAPQIVGIRLTSEGQIQLQVSGVPGHYVVEATTNLTVVDWVELTNMTTTEATFQCLDTEPNLAQRFYRVHLIP